MPFVSVKTSKTVGWGFHPNEPLIAACCVQTKPFVSGKSLNTVKTFKIMQKFTNPEKARRALVYAIVDWQTKDFCFFRKNRWGGNPNLQCLADSLPQGEREDEQTIRKRTASFARAMLKWTERWGGNPNLHVIFNFRKDERLCFHTTCPTRKESWGGKPGTCSYFKFSQKRAVSFGQTMPETGVKKVSEPYPTRKNRPGGNSGTYVYFRLFSIRKGFKRKISVLSENLSGGIWPANLVLFARFYKPQH